MSVISRLWASRKQRPLFVIFTGMVLGFFLVYPFIDLYLRMINFEVTPFTYNDFSSYTEAIYRWLHGQPIYWRGGWGFHGSYLYPPAYLLLFTIFAWVQNFSVLTILPFVHSTYEVGPILWGLFSLGLLWIGLQKVVRSLEVSLGVIDRIVLLWAIIGFQPFLYSFKWAQTGTFQAAIFCFSFVAFRYGRQTMNVGNRFASGFLTAIGGLMKLFYAPAGAHLLQDRDRFLGATLGGLFVLFLSITVFGIENLLLYLEVLQWGKGWNSVRTWYLWGPTYYEPLYAIISIFALGTAILSEFGLSIAMQESTSTLIRVVGLQTLRVGGLLGVILLSLGTRKNNVFKEVFALGLISVPLFAPQAYTYDLLILLPAAIILTKTEYERSGHLWLPVLSVFLLNIQAYGYKLLVDGLPPLIPIESITRPLVVMLQPGVWGNLILFGLAVFRIIERSNITRKCQIFGINPLKNRQ